MEFSDTQIKIEKTQRYNMININRGAGRVRLKYVSWGFRTERLW